MPVQGKTVQKSPAHRRTLQELTLKDNFLFAAVMSDPENCRQLLELALGLEIERVEIDTEKSILYHPEYRGVRLDVYARGEHHTRFNVEMQIANQALEKRVRYYHSQMDMELLLS
ncbi:MAG: PD-(D/E)XK nuclease family transposase, partial [Lachnoclostridium sp.]|nr:PD-(D/E)XK nuclease family transposase [Lachnospira sp.]MCM1249197.1 PD-(D/E)XK nuclease family transposase [Lachnoclostridium sp.]